MLGRSWQRHAVAVLAAALVTVAWPSAAGAATITVTEEAESATFDPADANGHPKPGAGIVTVSNGNGECSLREAVTASNDDGRVDGCEAGSGDDVIVVPAGDYDVLDHLEITNRVTIRGANASRPGNDPDRGSESNIRLVSNPSPIAQPSLFFLLGAAGGTRFDGLQLTGAFDTSMCPGLPSYCTASAVSTGFGPG
jgi:hypothetical protein